MNAYLSGYLQKTAADNGIPGVPVPDFVPDFVPRDDTLPEKARLRDIMTKYLDTGAARVADYRKSFGDKADSVLDREIKLYTPRNIDKSWWMSFRPRGYANPAKGTVTVEKSWMPGPGYGSQALDHELSHVVNPNPGRDVWSYIKALGPWDWRRRYNAIPEEVRARAAESKADLYRLGNRITSASESEDLNNRMSQVMMSLPLMERAVDQVHDMSLNLAAEERDRTRAQDIKQIFNDRGGDRTLPWPFPQPKKVPHVPAGIDMSGYMGVAAKALRDNFEDFRSKIPASLARPEEDFTDSERRKLSAKAMYERP